ncbi:hypothetical protein PFDG_05350, partial [Plasmodium falciparum Dd2]
MAALGTNIHNEKWPTLENVKNIVNSVNGGWDIASISPQALVKKAEKNKNKASYMLTTDTID